MSGIFGGGSIGDLWAPGANVWSEQHQTGVRTVLAPGANANGAVLRSLTQNSGASRWAVFVVSSAPTGWNDTSEAAVMQGAEPINWRGGIEVPAGSGVYLCNDGGSAGQASATFDLL